MNTRDQRLLEEAYISALQKSINVPTDSSTEQQPDSHLTPEQPVVMPITAEEPNDGPASDEHYQAEEEEETSMAAANLFSIFTDAKLLHDILQSGGHLETWMLQKIAVVADNLSSVAKVAKYDVAKGE